MPLKLHDTLTREKRIFEPLRDDRVTMYVCGPTVYNHAHIGNARPAVVFDVLFRLLQRLYPDRTVTYARNITDVDDKINQKAADEGVEISVITERYTDIYHRDLDGLNCLRPSVEPRATAHMGEMVALIEQLLHQGMAYVSTGEVLFDVAKFDAGSGRYGALSNRSLDDMIAGARVEVAGNKENAADFVLWKPSKPGEPSWPGPTDPGTGEPMPGRPGWHIECSAMAEKVLGLPFDIHGGGLDLIFPHHTNEIAQSCAAHGLQANTDYARFWMHNGFLTMDAEKMSKSLGNVSLISELVERVPGEVLRWALLSAHYRQPLDWTDALIQEGRWKLSKWRHVAREIGDLFVASGQWDSMLATLREHRLTIATEFRSPALKGAADWVGPLLDDLNTPVAFQNVEKFIKMAQRERNIAAHGQGNALMCARMAVSYLAQADLALEMLLGHPEFLTSEIERAARAILGSESANAEFNAQVEALLSKRMAARATKDWAAADRIRDELTALKVVVTDGPNGATWRRVESEG